MLKNARTFVLLVGIAAAVCSSAGAAVLKTLYLDEMVGESAVIVHATVLSSRSEWTANQGAIRTVYTARAHRYLKGFLGETFEFWEPGGQVGKIGMRVAGAPEFQAGEEALLFLWTDGRSGWHQCLGYEQGVLRVRQEGLLKVVNRSIPVRWELAGRAQGPGPTAKASSEAPRGLQVSGASRELRALMLEVAAAREQAEAAAAARKEAR